MLNLDHPLNDEELHVLDRFLFNRFEDDTYADDQDEGVLGISELDGMFTAIVSGPEVIELSDWLPAVWGDFEPEWENPEDATAIMTLMIRHMNGIAATLQDETSEFEPLFMEGREDDEAYIVVDEWCEGYLRGMDLAAEAWEEGGPEMAALTAPILAFTSASDWEVDSQDTAVLDELTDAITPNVREIHDWWFERRL
ncbi:MAG: UPF0149 family protein [Pseudomonadota bacterium]